ncbi:MAG: alpha/beta fold hydrolase [Ahniella sp.]|nr:alpha/beta fold hydrolase [Ahniella sp.]
MNTTMPEDLPLAPPPRRALLREGRAITDFLALAPRLLRSPPRTAKPQRIVVLPGFGADDRSTWPLRRILDRAGHTTETWGLGRNLAGLNIRHRYEDVSGPWQLQPPPARYSGEASVPILCDRMVGQIRQRFAADDPPVVLIGWSLGGVVAREVARELPRQIAQVITLGTPVQGGPKYTAAASVFRKRGMDLDWIERGIELRAATPIEVPITSVVSRSDAIVAAGAAMDRSSPRVRHVLVDAPHLSLCWRPEVWRIVLDALEQGR